MINRFRSRRKRTVLITMAFVGCLFQNFFCKEPVKFIWFLFRNSLPFTSLIIESYTFDAAVFNFYYFYICTESQSIYTKIIKTTRGRIRWLCTWGGKHEHWDEEDCDGLSLWRRCCSCKWEAQVLVLRQHVPSTGPRRRVYNFLSTLDPRGTLTSKGGKL